MSTSTVGLSAAEAWAEAEAELANSPEDDATSEDQSLPEKKQPEQPAPSESLFDSLDPVTEDEEGNILVSSDSTLVDVNGASVPLQELKNGYLRQSDYTKKTQELATLRKESEDAITFWQALQADPQGTLRKLNQRAGMVVPPTAPSFTPRQNEPPKGWGDDSATALGELVNKKLEEKFANDPRLKAWEQDLTKQLIDADFAKIESDYGLTLSDKDRLVVLKKADELKVTDLAFVFSGLIGQVERKKAMKTNVKKVSTSQGRLSTDKDQKPDADKVPEDFWEGVQQAMDELDIDDLSRAF